MPDIDVLAVAEKLGAHLVVRFLVKAQLLRVFQERVEDILLMRFSEHPFQLLHVFLRASNLERPLLLRLCVIESICVPRQAVTQQKVQKYICDRFEITCSG